MNKSLALVAGAAFLALGVSGASAAPAAMKQAQIGAASIVEVVHAKKRMAHKHAAKKRVVKRRVVVRKAAARVTYHRVRGGCPY